MLRTTKFANSEKSVTRSRECLSLFAAIAGRRAIVHDWFLVGFRAAFRQYGEATKTKATRNLRTDLVSPLFDVPLFEL